MKILDRFKLTKGELVVLFTFGGIILLPYFAFPDYYRTLQVQAQLQQQEQQQPLPMMTINVISPMTGEEVPVGELTISGTSTDNAATDCTVYADWNNLKPFQKAVATGPGGVNDYSTWTFTYTVEYHLITNGINNLTSRLSCVDDSDITNITKSYSVKVIGINEDSESDIGGGTTGSTAEGPLEDVDEGTTGSTAEGPLEDVDEGTTGGTSGGARGDVDEGTTGGTSGGARGDVGGGTTGGTSGGARGQTIERPYRDPNRGITGSITGSE